jgi:hypothetical protein
VIVIGAVALFALLDPRHGSGHGRIETYEQFVAHQLTHDFGQRLETIDENLKEPFFGEVSRSVFGMPLGPLCIKFVGGIAVVIAGIAITPRRPVWGLWIIATFAMLIIFISLDRYVLQILPVLLIACWEGLRWMDRRVRWPYGSVIAVLLLAVALTCNGIQFVTIIDRQHQHPFLASYKEGRFPGYIAMSHEVARLTTRDDLTLCSQKYARILSFLSDRLVIEGNVPGLDLSKHRLFVIDDPADSDLKDWLAREHVRFVGDPLVTEPRLGLRPAITLRRARID